MRPIIYLMLGTLLGCSNEYAMVSDHVIVDEPRQRTIEYRLWMPVTSPGAPKPLILVSHGSGGDFSNHQWLIDALLSHGYVVAAPNHPFNTTQDNTPRGIVEIWQRPADMSLVLADLLEHPQYASQIAAEQVGVAGFSSGGYTAIALAGARFDPVLMDAYCRREDRGPDCDLSTGAEKVDYSDAPASYRDPRIKAVFAMAPAVGPAITIPSLQEIDVPTFITAAADDELVYPKFGAHHYASHIPSATLKMVPEGGHFVFLDCTAITWVADQFIDEFDLCGAAFAVDRQAIAETTAKQAIAFFDQSLRQL